MSQYNAYPAEKVVPVTQAPGFAPPMQPVILMHQKKNEQGQNVFNHGLCTNCCASSNWWLACCCPCLAYGVNRTRLLSLRTTGQPHPEQGEMVGSDCFLFAAIQYCFGAGWVFEMINRTDVRERYHLEGSGCGDCCTAFWCSPCSMEQVNLQLKDEEQALMSSKTMA